MKKSIIHGITAVLVLSTISLASGQDLIVDGKASITKMDTVNTGTSNVVKQADGTLAIRHYKVGDFAQGGIVFWVDGTGEHGLAVAKSDQSISIRWYAGTFGRTRALGVGPLSGEMNTAVIIAAQVGIGDDGGNYAALVTSDHSSTEGGITYGDWYLPSRDELIIMYNNKDAIDATAVSNGGSSFANLRYWSSTEFDQDEAFVISFLNGIQTNLTKDSALARVRAIRAF